MTHAARGLRVEPGDVSGDSAMLIRSGVLSGFAEVALARGLNPHALVVRVGLDPRCIVDCDLKVSAAKISELLELAAAKSGDRALGLAVAVAKGPPDLGPLNLLLREEPNLRSALRSLQSFLHVYSRSLRIVLDESDPQAPTVSGFLVARAHSYGGVQGAEMVLGGVLMSLRWLAGPRWSPALVCFSHAAPASTAAHERAFGCPVEFGHALDALVLSPEDLNRPVASANPVLRSHAEHYVRSLATMIEPDFALGVRGVIAGLLPSGECSADRVAQQFGTNRNTLGRRLARTDQSYATLLQETRSGLARRLCLSGLPLQQVAEQLGFAAPSIFSRWFRDAFGCSATEWLRRRTSEDA